MTTTSDRLVELVSAIDTDGYLPLIDAMMTAEHESGSKFGTYLFEEEKAYWEAMSLSTLCSMPEQVVKELICGNLKQAYDSDQDLREKLDEFRERGKQHHLGDLSDAILDDSSGAINTERSPGRRQIR